MIKYNLRGKAYVNDIKNKIKIYCNYTTRNASYRKYKDRK
jgi:hypothetical protein